MRVKSEDGKSGRFVDRAVAPRYETRPNCDTTGGPLKSDDMANTINDGQGC